MRMMGEVQIQHLGVTSESLLDPQTPIAYKSDKSFQIGDPNGKKSLMNLDLAPDVIKKLQDSNAKFFFRNRTKPSDNFHIFSTDADSIDGIERICYVSYNGSDESFRVSEYCGPRGANYSALYPLLKTLLRENTFDEANDSFLVPLHQLDLFLDIIAQINYNKSSGKYVLFASSEADSVTLSGIKYYYYKVFWAVKPPISQKNDVDDFPDLQVKLSHIDKLIRDVAECSLTSRDSILLQESEERIKALHVHLDTCSEVMHSRIEALEKVQSLKSLS